LSAAPLNAGAPAAGTIRTDIPLRLDRLPWSRFHLLVLVALGITWVLDGIEVTIVGAIAPALRDQATLGISTAEIGNAASAYVVGAVVGALLFGWLTDRFGRRKMFYVTLGVYLVGVLLTAMSWGFLSFALFRAITGFGIGGEYAAINSAIDELIPARYRGRADIIVNGSFWLGATIGSGAAILFLNPRLFAPDIGWRLGFAAGGVLGLGILLLRRYVPESPRWLIIHGYQRDAEAGMAGIEERVEQYTKQPLPAPHGSLKLRPQRSFGLATIAGVMLGKYRIRGALVLSLMIAQAFLFNAVFFTYGLVMTTYYDVPDSGTGFYLVLLAVSNFLGPVVLGPLFDTIGRRVMISLTYGAGGLLLFGAAIAFAFDAFSAGTQTAAWMAIFFFASAGASAAYLTASEIFPLESRAVAIALFYAIGTAVGGAIAPTLFGVLIATGKVLPLSCGYALAAALMLGAALFEAIRGVDAEGRSLEQLAEPLSAA
jgi:MFS family permease